MPANVIAPGVYRKITDLDTYVQAVPSTIGFICFFSDRGPDNKVTFVSSEKDLITRFGKPNFDKYGQGMYNAVQFIRNSDSLYVVRVTAPDAAYANVTFTLDGNHKFVCGSEANMNSEDEIATYVGAPNVAMMFYGLGRGENYNNLAVSIAKSASLPGLHGYVVDIWDEDITGDMVIKESFVVSLDPKAMNAGRSIYIEDIINTYSNLIRVKTNKDVLADYCDFLDAMDANDASQYTGSTQFYYDPNNLSDHADITGCIISGGNSYKHLENGSEGALFQNGKLDWNTAESYLVQAYLGSPQYYDPAVTNRDLLYFSVVFDADYPDGVKDAIKTLCADIRQDCVGILDNGYHAGPNALQDALNDANNLHAYNSEYVALYENHSIVYDEFTGKDILVAPSYHLARVIPVNDRVAEPWFAAAGFRRGVVTGVKGLAFYPQKGDRDQLYIAQLNPIVKMKPGYAIFGQNTTKKTSGALRDLNIMRLVLYVDRAVSDFALNYIFEQNDRFTWNDFKDAVASFLEDIVARRGLHSYTVEVSATDYEMQIDQFHCDITLHAVSAVEKIMLNYYVTKKR